MGIFEGTGIPKRFQKFRPTDSISQIWNTRYEQIKEQVKNKGITLVTGGRGLGKTQAAATVGGFVRHEMKRTVHYTNAMDVFMNLRNGNNQNSDTTEVKEQAKLLKPHLLIIDAFEVRGETAYENRVMNHIIDRRYADEKPTIIITNETLQSFAKSVGESLIDRLSEGGGVVQFEGSSMRPEIAKHRRGKNNNEGK